MDEELFGAHFEECDVLGSGSFGQVLKVPLANAEGFRAMVSGSGTFSFSRLLRKSDEDIEEELETKEFAVVKVMQLRDPEDRDEQERVASLARHASSEAEILKDISHQHIRRFYAEVGSMNGEEFFLVLENLPGESVTSRLKSLGRTYLKELDCALLFANVASAIEYLHERDIIHRDIKLQNMILPPDNNYDVKLIDFGMAIQTTEPIISVKGTLVYCSPEALISKGYQKPLDIWAMGVCLFTCLCGAFPFYDSDPLSLGRKIVQGRPTYAISFWLQMPDAQEIVKSLLNKKPESRMTAEEFLNTSWIHKAKWRDGKFDKDDEDTEKVKEAIALLQKGMRALVNGNEVLEVMAKEIEGMIEHSLDDISLEE